MELLLSVTWALFILATPLPISLYWATRLDTCGSLRPSLARLTLFSLTIWVFIQISLALALGLFHLFTPKYVLSTHLLLAISSLYRPIRQSIRNTVAGEIRSQRISAPEMAILLMWSTIFIAAFLRNLYTPISNFDSLAYHLPNMATWLQNGRFTMVDSALLFQVNRYPYDWQAMNALFLMPFRNDILVTLPTILSLVLFGLAIYCLARHLNQHRLPALFATFLATTLPLELDLLNTVQVDLAFAAFCIIAVYTAILFVTTHHHGHAIIGVVALAMIPGIKINGLLYLAVLTTWGLFLWLLMKRCHPTRWRDTCPHPTKKYTINASWLAGLLCLWVGGFWYVRNWLLVGNPLGHIPLNIGAFTIFPGEHIVSVDYLKHTSLAALMRTSSQVNDWQVILDQIALRFGFPLFILTLFFAPSIPRYVFTDTKQERIIYLALVTLLVFSIYLYWTSPYSGASGSGSPAEWRIHPWIGWNLRFALVPLALLAVIAALGLPPLNIPSPIVAVLASVSWALSLSHLLEKTSLMLLLPLIALAFTLCNQEKHFQLSMMTRVFFFFMIICGVAIPFANIKRICVWDEYYGGIPAILEKTAHPNDAVGYLSLIKIFPLLGKDLQRKVIDISGKASNYDDFVKFISQAGIGCIAVNEQPLEKTREIDWIKRDDFIFNKIFPTTSSHWKNSTILYCQ